MVFDLSKITISEYRQLAGSDMFDPASDAILAKAAGVPVEQIAGMSYDDYRRALRDFFQAARSPLADPT